MNPKSVLVWGNLSPFAVATFVFNGIGKRSA